MCDTKKCKQCGQIKPITEFYTHKTNKDGLQGVCKICANANQKKYNNSGNFDKTYKSSSYEQKRQQYLLDHANDYKQHSDDFIQIEGYERYLFSPSIEKAWDTKTCKFLKSGNGQFTLLDENGGKTSYKITKIIKDINKPIKSVFDLTDFTEIEGCSRYLLSPDDRVWDKLRNRFRTIHNKDGRLTVTLNTDDGNRIHTTISRIKNKNIINPDNFTKIDGFSRYLLSEGGEIWDLDKGRLLKFNLKSRKSIAVMINDKGERKSITIISLLGKYFPNSPTHQQFPKVKRPSPTKEERKRRATERVKKREARDINFKIANRLRGRLYQSIKNKVKNGSAVKDLGLSLDNFKQYIEEQFTDGMSWDNYGEWHLDHRIPLSWFNLEDRGEFRYAANYCNYQPLWAEENRRKNNKFISE